jgi:DUF1365 family protein
VTARASALYAGTVVHSRTRPKAHALSYSLFMGLFDLDELAGLGKGLRLFGYNAAALISFYDKDHGDRDGAPLRPWVEARLAEAGVEAHGGPIRLLCMPRVLGHVFNPISVYFCHRPDQSLAAIVYEVNNTFGGTHSYVLAAGEPGLSGVIAQRCAKRLYVSPFMDMDLTYDFRIRAPDEKAAVLIDVSDADGQLLHAAFAGERRPLDDAGLLKAWISHPLLSLKVLAGIHWEALWIWLKGVGYRPPSQPVGNDNASQRPLFMSDPSR